MSRLDKALGAFTILNITLTVLVFGLGVGLPTQPLPVAADVANEQPFDHSGCQYPDRTTNPPNGCDNSDPCDPANVKGGSGDCAPTPVSDNITAPGTVKSEPVKACGK